MTQEELKELFIYKDWELFWKERPSNKVDISKPAGYIDVQGYRVIRINGKNYKAHRLIWILINGEIPEGLEIDHKNHIRNDNNIENLRLVSHQDNGKNVSIRSNNTSGHTGVFWHKPSKKWQAQISINKKLIHLGLFNDINEAIKARESANLKYNFHSNHGA